MSYTESASREGATIPTKDDMTITRRYALAELEAMPVLHQGQYDNLLISTSEADYAVEGDEKLWLSRLTKEDGMEYDHEVTVSRLVDGTWRCIDRYDASKVVAPSLEARGRDSLTRHNDNGR